MTEPTHAPGWRGRPRRIGPLESELNVPAWLVLLERVAPIGCFTIAAFSLALAAYAFGADYLAGHIG
jgi:hypothetical protein